MTIHWNDLQLDVKFRIIERLNFYSRANLSACSRLDREVVRKSKYNFKRVFFSRNEFSIENDGIKRSLLLSETGEVSRLCCKESNCMKKRKTPMRGVEWKEAILDMMSLIGWKISTDSLELRVEHGFENHFNWLRANIEIKPRKVVVGIHTPEEELYEESIEPYIDWPQKIPVRWYSINYRGPFLEKHNSYDNIVELETTDIFGGGNKLDDEKLMKLPNVRELDVDSSLITAKGFHWWLKKWLTRKSIDKHSFHAYHDCKDTDAPFAIDKIVNGFDDLVEDILRINNGWKFKIRKNENETGAIYAHDNRIYFCSPISKPTEIIKDENYDEYGDGEYHEEVEVVEDEEV